MFRASTMGVVALFALSLVFVGPGGWVAAADDSRLSVDLSATLDGVPIPVADVAKYFCDDFAYPVITCSTSKLVINLRATTLTLLTSIDYVTIYEKTSYGGASMNVSQDYPTLFVIGWDDRISSFRARNGETGQFFTNWFSTGSSWPFCCNSQVPSLGAYDNTFSSVERT